MKHSLIDTNVIIRYLVEDPETIKPKFKGVYSFFEKVERGETKVLLPELVLFEAFFVLTSFYEVPTTKAAHTSGSPRSRFRASHSTAARNNASKGSSACRFKCSSQNPPTPAPINANLASVSFIESILHSFRVPSICHLNGAAV
ncbi:hypothetical protein P4C99_20560 [Pontiellaceae bacterium B1224]|nr:hypothetical protein [Pontiellaceae bacterium B1224]